MNEQEADRIRLELEALAEGEGDSTPVFLAHLSHEASKVREAAVWGLLASTLAQAHLALMAAARRDPSEEVRAAAVFVLGHFLYESQLIGLEREEPPLQEVVGQVDAMLHELVTARGVPQLVRRRALETLSFKDSPLIEDTIDMWSRSPDTLLRKSAAFAMGRANIERFARALLKALEDPSPMVRLEAVRSVGDQGLRRGVSRLSMLARGEDQELALEAIKALAQVGGKQALTCLKEISRLRDKSRAQAAKQALADSQGDEL